MNCESIHPTVVGHVVKTSRHGSACRVHKNVEATELLCDLIYAASASCRVGNVALQKSSSRVNCLECGWDFMHWINAGSRNGYDVRTFVRQTKRGGGSDAAGAAGDETDFPLKIHDPSLDRRMPTL
jgi:hypothetical protein